MVGLPANHVVSAEIGWLLESKIGKSEECGQDPNSPTIASTSDTWYGFLVYTGSRPLLTKSWWMVYRWHFCCDEQIGHRFNKTIKWPCHHCGMASRALSQSFIPFVYGFSKGPNDSASQTPSHPLADLLDPSGVANLLCNAPWTLPLSPGHRLLKYPDLHHIQPLQMGTGPALQIHRSAIVVLRPCRTENTRNNCMDHL